LFNPSEENPVAPIAFKQQMGEFFCEKEQDAKIFNLILYVKVFYVKASVAEDVK